MSERYWLGCRPKHDVEGEDQLEDGCGHLTQGTTSFGPWTHNMHDIYASGNQFFDVAQHYPERRVFLVPRPSVLN